MASKGYKGIANNEFLDLTNLTNRNQGSKDLVMPCYTVTKTVRHIFETTSNLTFTE